jgi:hypothetical protein
MGGGRAAAGVRAGGGLMEGWEAASQPARPALKTACSCSPSESPCCQPAPARPMTAPFDC